MAKQEREALRMMFGGRCAYCGCELIGRWHADHVEPVIRRLAFVRNDCGTIVGTKSSGGYHSPQNNRQNNLFPACAPCNIDKSSNSLEGWREYLHWRIVERLRANSSTFRHAERFGVVSINPAPLVFWFEKYSKEASDDE